MTSGGAVRVETDGPVAILRFDRPEKKNAITSAMYLVLADALEAAGQSDRVGVAVFLGSPGAFCAGNDIADFIRATAEGEALDAVLRFLRALVRFDRPLMAGVDGPAIGIGATLLFHCDYVLATPRALLRTPFTALGLTPEAASSLLGPRIMGHPAAFELLVMGEDFDAEKACARGIVNAIVPEDELEGRILDKARLLASRPREAVLAARHLLKGDPAEVLARIDREAEVFAERLASPEAQAAFAAFMGKGKA